MSVNNNGTPTDRVGERLLPADINAERAMLGSILLERDAIIAVASWFDAKWFYLEKHQWIYEAALACYQAEPSTPPDIATVSDELRRRDQLDAIGGIAFLGELITDVPTAVHVEYYAEIVATTGRRRDLIQAGGEIVALGYNERQAVDDAYAQAEAKLFALTQRSERGGYRSVSECVQEHQAWYESVVEHGGSLGVPTGFLDLDYATGGLQRSDLIILAARPSVGKTALALAIADHVARNGGVVGFVSLEMSRNQLILRLVSMRSGLSMQQLSSTHLNDDQHLLRVQTLGACSNMALHIDDTAQQSVSCIRSNARALHARHGCDLIIVDHIQIAEASGRRDNRNLELGEISRGLKAMAKEMDVPVLALSQLSRAVEGRASHVPQLSDLRESGRIEEDADIVLMLYREELYDKDTDKKGIAELYIRKHRNGQTGLIPLSFDAERVRFQNLVRHREIAGY